MGMRKLVEFGVAISGLGTFLLSRAKTISEWLSFISLPDEVRKAIVILSTIPNIIAYSVLFVGAAGLLFLLYDYGLYAWCLSLVNNNRVRRNGAPVAREARNDNQNREFTDRSPQELLAPYKLHTGLQADKLMESFKGTWIKTEGVIHGLYADAGGRSVCVLRETSSSCAIECRFSQRWNSSLSRRNNGDILRVVGCIAPYQNGAQLYLLDCEIADD